MNAGNTGDLFIPRFSSHAVCIFSARRTTSTASGRPKKGKDCPCKAEEVRDHGFGYRLLLRMINYAERRVLPAKHVTVT
jgi:hypothetical protein